VERFEPEHGWSLDAVPERFVASLLPGILAFVLPVRELQAKAKLGQNRSRDDREGVIAALRARGAHALADAMERVLTRDPGGA
jgi:transcriptional regulator